MSGRSNDSHTSTLSDANRKGAGEKSNFFGKKEAGDSFFSSKEGDSSFFPSNNENSSSLTVQRKCSKCEKEENQQKEHPDIQTKPAFESESDAPEGLQTKLKIGQANDGYEREADAMADKVVKRISGEKASTSSEVSSDHAPPIQTKCSKCGAGMAEKEVQTKKEQNNSKSNDTASIGDRLAQRKGKGSPMGESSRSSMESAFGADFNNVNIHQDNEAAELNKSLNSKAFTHGSDIYFGENNYQPSSKEGQSLLAHELTHTIHQGAAVQRKDEVNSDAQEEKLQQAPDEMVQKISCPENNSPGEQPPEGQEEPAEEESPAVVEAQEGASVDERQEDAPDCDEFAPPEAENIAEEASSQIPEEDTTSLEQSEQETEQATQQEGEGTRSTQQSTAAVGQQSAGESESFTPNPEGMGEAASPEVQAARDAEQGKEQGAADALTAIQGSLGTLQAGNISFAEKEIEDEHEAIEYRRRKSGSEAIANQFFTSASSRVQSFIDAGMALPATIGSNNAEKEARLQAAIQQKRAQTSSAITAFKAQARAKAASARARSSAKEAATVIQIITKTIQAKAQVEQNYQTSRLAIEQERGLQLQEINQIYTDADRDFRAVGPRIAAISRTRGNAAATEFEGKKTGRKDGFWDGYLKDNRHQARADSAREVGQQYAEGMSAEGNKQADCAKEGKSKDIEAVHTIADQSLERLELTKSSTLSGLDTAQQNAIVKAGQTKQSMLSSLSSSLNATISSLDTQEASQLQLINDYGVRQSMAIVRDGLMASASIVQGVHQAAGQLVDFLSAFSAQISGMQAPEPAEFKAILSGFEQQFEANVLNAINLTQQSADSTSQNLEMGAIQALAALDDLAFGGIANAQQLKDDFVTATNQLENGAITGFDQQLSGYNSTTDATVASALLGFTTLVSGIQQIYQTVGQNLRTQFTAKVQQMEDGLRGVLDEQLEDKICTEAEKAASEVQPWWKTALKILLVIVVIVVIALVIGPAVIGAVGAAAGALGASAGAATFIGTVVGGAILGAASGAVIQVGNNLIDGKDWDVGVVDAIIVGAVTGALGGFLGGAGNVFAQRLADAGRLGASGLMQSSLKFGIEMAFDTAGNILGDLAVGNPITLQSVLQGAAMGAAVTISTTNLSRMGRFGAAAEGIQQRSMGLGQRVGGSIRGPRPGVDAPGARAGADGPSPRPEAEGSSPRPVAEGPTPRSEADGPTPRSEAEGPTPRQDAEGGPSRRPETETDAADARVREEVESLGPMSRETQEMLANNPRLRQALTENPQAAAAFKKCSSPCFPSDATPEQVRAVNDLIASRGGPDFPDSARLHEFLHANRGDLDGALARLNADYEATLRPPSPEQVQSGRDMAAARGLDESPNPTNPPVPDSQRGGYEWYRARDGSLQVRNKPGNDGPAVRYDAENGTFEPSSTTRPRPERSVIETDRSTVSRSDLDPAHQQRLLRLEQARSEAHQRKQDALAAGDAEATSRAHGDLVRASEWIGEGASIAAMRRLHPDAQPMDTSLPGRQQSGEFDQVYINRTTGEVFVIEAKGGGSRRGSRRTGSNRTGPRAEQGTPEYIRDIELNMQQEIDGHVNSPRYQTDEQFRSRIESLQRTVDAITIARDNNNLRSLQVSQRVQSDGTLNPNVEITEFDPSRSLDTSNTTTN